MKTINTQCPMCKSHKSIDLDETQWLQWQRGMPIQKAFPWMDSNTRERLISGTCPTCWDQMFSDDDDYGVPA